MYIHKKPPFKDYDFNSFSLLLSSLLPVFALFIDFISCSIFNYYDLEPVPPPHLYPDLSSPNNPISSFCPPVSVLLFMLLSISLFSSPFLLPSGPAFNSCTFCYLRLIIVSSRSTRRR